MLDSILCLYILFGESGSTLVLLATNSENLRGMHDVLAKAIRGEISHKIK